MIKTYVNQRMIALLEELEKLGTIVIMDKEQGDYALTTTRPVSASKILDMNLGPFNYQIKKNKEYNNWTIDFNLHGKDLRGNVMQ